MDNFKIILKRSWKGMLMLFIGVCVLSFVMINMSEKRAEETKSELIKAKAFNFDIRTYNYLGDGTASVYDATPIWNDETMLRDFIKRLSENDMNVLEPKWESWDIKTKVSWVQENLEVKRYATSTMYSVQYSTEITEANKEQVKKACDSMLKNYVEYAADLVKLTDEKISYKVVKDIEEEEKILTQKEIKVNALLYLAVSIVLGALVSITYFAIKAMKYGRQKK